MSARLAAVMPHGAAPRPLGAARRRGHSLPELLVALTLFGLLSVSAASVFRSHMRLAQRAVDRAERADALRIATLVLSAETRFLRADRDVFVATADSVRLRAYRGMAIVCATSGAVAFVRYTGLRDPNPQKDSVLLLRGDTLETTAGVVGASGSAACGAGDQPGWRLELSRAAASGDILLIFEAGTYYLTGSALRYRLGAEGRQPITTERLDDRSTRFEAMQHGVLRLSLATRALPAIGERDQVHVRIPMLNQVGR